MFVIIGYTKTPHESYKSLEGSYNNVIYLIPDDQDKLSHELSEKIGCKPSDNTKKINKILQLSKIIYLLSLKRIIISY